MRVKRYVVDSMPEALQRIRSELGNDAVILSTKDIKSGGIFGLFSKKKIEVMAAVDAGGEELGMTSGVKANPAQQTMKVDSMPAPAASAVHSASVVHQAKRSDHEVVSEIKQLKKMMLQIAGDRVIYPEALTVWQERLSRQQFHPDLIDKLLSEVMERYQSQFPEKNVHDLALDEAAELLKHILLERLQRKSIKTIDEQTKFVQFVGPTGVGKTTTIAKLAAEQVLTRRARVGLITSDTFRIAAVEQLRTYANILNVPLEVVNSPQELNRAFEKIGDVDIVMMDTAGRNFRNEMYVSEMSSMLQSNEKQVVYLVLSLTMKYDDMCTVVENFSRYHMNNILFTKMDETDTFGPIFNLLDQFEQLNMSYITTGQNVPDDISTFHADRLVNRIMEGWQA